MKGFYDLKGFCSLLACPICGSEFDVKDGKSLICRKNHCYDIAGQGYVNFTSARDKTYPQELFRHRHSIFEAGFYLPLVKKIEELISCMTACHAEGQNCTILDAGCGEGYYIRSIDVNVPVKKIAFDISKEAVRMAAKRDRGGAGCGDSFFMAADLGKIPVKDDSADILLNLFAPANYAEFKRVLKKDGILMKAVPGSGYLMELRRLAKDMLKKQEYDNTDILRHFKSNMEWLKTETCRYTMPADRAQAESLAKMTPMLSHIDAGRLPLERIDEVTVHVDILIGKGK